MSSDQVGPDLLLELGTSTLCEASSLPCSLDYALRPVWRGAATAGPAYPLRCAAGDNLAIHVAVERAAPGSVLVIDAGGHLAGYWGEVLTVAAEARGIAGLVIDGGVRDIDALERRRFPVFARGVAMRGTVKSQVPSVGKPIVVAGVVVAPGDLVVADTDGVLVLPAAHVDATVKAAQSRQRREIQFMERLRRGETTLEMFGLTNARTLA